MNSKSFDMRKFDRLSVNADKGNKDETSYYEALTAMQAEGEEIVTGAERPDKRNEIERKKDIDFKVIKCSKHAFPDPYNRAKRFDAKAIVDPETIVARGFPYQSFETQIDNILDSIILQRDRIKGFNEEVVHIISLLRVKPADRAYCIKILTLKAAQRGIDRNGIYFLNTSDFTV